MTPDRPDHTPDEAENGVLSETGSIDTTGLGILGGGTAQVNVELPTASEDDDLDDEVIDGEVPFVVEIPADAALPVAAAAAPSPETAEAEIIEVEQAEYEGALEEWTIEEGADAPAEAEAVEDITDAEEVIDEPEPVLAEAEADVAVSQAEVLEAEVSQAEAPEVEAPAVEATAETDDAQTDAETAVAEFDAEDFDAAEYDDIDFADAEFDGAEFDDVTIDDTPEASMTASTPGDDARAAQPTAPSPATGPTPATRREAHQTGALPMPPRPATPAPAAAVERVSARAETPGIRPEVALSSKRLGEFETDRETADLLTADRLLDPHQVVRPEPEGVWQQLVYSISGRRINLGDSKRARARKELDRRIAAPLAGGARFVPVLSRKGGVGKTTITTLLGMALADARDDRVIAVDANPDRGTLAERIARESGKTVRDLVRISGDVVGFNDLSNIVARDETRLDVVASDSDPRVSEAFNDDDYRNVAALAAHYYSVVLTDTGTGIVHSVMGATLDLADQLVIVAGLSVDEARLASETLTWLETNGHADKVRSAVVVLNNSRPGHPLVQLNELEAHFRTRVRAVVRMPYDSHIAAGSGIVFRELQPATRLAARELAATVVEGLRSYSSAA